MTFDGPRTRITPPPSARAILPLIDEQRSILAGRWLRAEACGKAWHQTFAVLERVSRVLPPRLQCVA